MDEAPGARPRSPRRPTRPIALVVSVAVLAGAVAVGWVVLRREPVCAALGSRVANFNGFYHENGITSFGNEWISVLANGATGADEGSRRPIAEATQADHEGYERFRRSLPEEVAATADRLRALAADPVAAHARRADDDVRRDARALDAHGMTTCGFL